MSVSLASLDSIFKRFQNDNFDITFEPLGKGATAAVFPVKYAKKTHGKKTVIKLYYKEDDKKREVEMLQKISGLIWKVADADQSKNALFDKFVALDESGDSPSAFAIFERCQKNLKFHFDEDVNSDEVLSELKKILIHHLFPAIIFMHDNGIIHGDLKAENIMYQNKHWKLIDFGCAALNMEPTNGGTYIPPEQRLAISAKKIPKATVKVDAFALGITIIDLLSLDSNVYWELVESDPDFTVTNIKIRPPTQMIGGDSVFKKIAEILEKDPDERKTVKKFSKNAIFQEAIMTRDFRNAELSEILGAQNKLLQGQDKIIETQQEIIGKLDNILQNMLEFLPAIQENLMSMMAESSLPNRFILVPSESGNFSEKLTKHFYTKFQLFFICDCGGHIAKSSESDGYSFLQVTNLGKGVLMISKILLTVAIKQIAGADLGHEIDQVLSLGLGETSKALDSIPGTFLHKKDMFNGIPDAPKDWEFMKKSFNQVTELVAGIDPKDMSAFQKAKTEQDWIEIFAPLKPLIKEFLKGKDLAKMGVQLGQRKNGKAVWICKTHYPVYQQLLESDPGILTFETKKEQNVQMSNPTKVKKVTPEIIALKTNQTFYKRNKRCIWIGVGIGLMAVVVGVIVYLVVFVFSSSSTTATSAAKLSNENTNGNSLTLQPSQTAIMASQTSLQTTTTSSYFALATSTASSSSSEAYWFWYPNTTPTPTTTSSSYFALATSTASSSSSEAYWFWYPNTTPTPTTTSSSYFALATSTASSNSSGWWW